jgi:hypothetical protein
MENANFSDQNMVEKNSRNLPRDTFLYLASLILLIASVLSFGFLVFGIINIYFPDILHYYNVPVDSLYVKQGLIQPLSVLIIVFPLFLFVARFLRKDVVNFPEKREMKIRKWLLYLTLFMAVLAMVIDLVAVFRGFLSGELTTRFLLKALTVLFIASVSFYYYITELKNPQSNKLKWIIWPTLIIVLAGFVLGMYTVGMPKEQRKIRMDEIRINHLGIIQAQVTEYWRKNQKLPMGTDQLNDAISGFVVPVDPRDGRAYDYTVLSNQKNDLRFRLCADFETQSVSDGGVEKMNDPNWNWQHSIGKKCFDRVIDTNLYLPIIK